MHVACIHRLYLCQPVSHQPIQLFVVVVSVAVIFFVDFSMLLRRALETVYIVHSLYANKDAKDREKKNLQKLIFNLEYLAKQKQRVYTCLECKAATAVILVRVASTSNNKSNNIQPMKSGTIAK